MGAALLAGLKAIGLAIWHGIKIVGPKVVALVTKLPAMAGTVAMKATGSAAIGEAVTSGVKVGMLVGAAEATNKLTDKLPEVIGTPLRISANAVIFKKIGLGGKIK